MSLTSSIEIVGASYWTYMAAVIAESLGKMIRHKRVSPGMLPKGVYSDAMEFFRQIMQSVNTAKPDTPTTNLNAYLIAAEAVRESSPVLHETQDVDDCLKEFSSFIKSLKEPRDLTKEELKLAKILQKFFLQLQEDGETEAYERRFERGAPLVWLRSPVINR